MDARPGGPTAKREPSPEGLGLNPEDDLPGPGVPWERRRRGTNSGPAHPCVIRSKLRISYYAALINGNVCGFL
jgi:hypothetical protein